MRSTDLRTFLAICASALLAACGGGGGTATSPLPSSVTPANGTKATFVVKVPSKAAAASGNKIAQYITANVKAIDFNVTQTGTNATGYAFYPLTPTSPNCVSGASGLTCTLQVVAPPGNDTFTVRLYDAVEVGNAYIVAAGTLSQTITAQSSNTISITTYGVASFASVGTANPYPSIGVAATIPLAVQVTDPDGAVIVGAYDQPVTLSDSDTSGATTLSKTSLAQSSDATGLTLSYSGSPSAAANITVRGTSPQLAADYLSPLLGTIAVTPGGSGPAASPSALYFAHPTSGAQTVTLTGEGSAIAPYSLTAGSCGSIVSISGTSPTFTVTPLASSFNGTLPQYGGGACTITATDSASHATGINVLVGL